MALWIPYGFFSFVFINWNSSLGTGNVYCLAERHYEIMFYVFNIYWGECFSFMDCKYLVSFFCNGFISSVMDS